MKKGALGWAILGLMVGFLLANVLDLRRLIARMPRRPAAAREEVLTNVWVQRMEPTNLVERAWLPGTVEALHAVQVAAEIGGRVDWVAPKEGVSVAKGDPLVKIDTQTLQAACDQAKANLQLAESNLSRAKQLFKENLIAPNELDRIEAELETSRANSRVAEIELAKGTVSAPLDGILDQCIPEVGEYVNKGDSVAWIVQVDDVKVVVDVPERFVAAIRPTSRARVHFDFIPSSAFEADVSRVQTRPDDRTRTYRAELIVENPEQQLKPGMIARVEFAIREIREAIAVPLFAIIPRKGRYYVFLENNSTAHLREITMGLVEAERAEVTAGLAAGENLVINGQRFLRDGERVKVQNPSTIP